MVERIADNIRHVLVDLECRMVVVREVFVIVVEVVFDNKDHLEVGLTSFDYSYKLVEAAVVVVVD